MAFRGTGGFFRPASTKFENGLELTQPRIGRRLYAKTRLAHAEEGIAIGAELAGKGRQLSGAHYVEPIDHAKVVAAVQHHKTVNIQCGRWLGLFLIAYISWHAAPPFVPVGWRVRGTCHAQTHVPIAHHTGGSAYLGNKLPRITASEICIRAWRQNRFQRCGGG